MGGKHSDQGAFDDANLLTWSPDRVIGMKDVGETPMHGRAGATGRTGAAGETGHLGMGFVWPIMETRDWREAWAGGDPENQDTKTTLWPLCFHRSLDLGEACCLEK